MALKDASVRWQPLTNTHFHFLTFGCNSPYQSLLKASFRVKLLIQSRHAFFHENIGAIEYIPLTLITFFKNRDDGHFLY